jgi:hypothetical protein
MLFVFNPSFIYGQSLGLAFTKTTYIFKFGAAFYKRAKNFQAASSQIFVFCFNFKYIKPTFRFMSTIKIIKKGTNKSKDLLPPVVKKVGGFSKCSELSN